MPAFSAIYSVRLRSFVVLITVSLLVASSSAAGQAGASPKTKVPANWSIRWQPLRLVNGSPVVFQVKPSVRLQSLSGKWLDHEVFFAFDPKTGKWFGLAGVSLETAPGRYSLQLKAATADGKELNFEREITIAKKKYRSIAVNVAKKFTEPSPEQLQVIEQEKTLKHDTFARVTPQREWSGSFRAPVNANVSDGFGTARTFNGKTQSVHQGLDYAVPQGTRVAALNGGTILLARPLFFEGNCVVIDHGQGLLTLYMHLSEFTVKEGDVVRRGQEVGVSGGTGRATGPHLHIAVRWDGVYVDPATLLSLSLP